MAATVNAEDVDGRRLAEITKLGSLWFLCWLHFFFLILQRQGGLRYLSAVRCRPLEWLGRHSLVIYMVHQPLVYAVLYVLFL